MALLFSLREFGSAFATRGRGAELREAVLAKSADEPVVILDFTDVTNVSYSFADEFVGKLSSADPDSSKIELVNMAPSVGQIVLRARERRTSIVAC
jgi:anti-anti-sigma regulatory factor